MKVGDLVKDKLWGRLGIVVCVPPMPSMIEVFWSGDNPQKTKASLGRFRNVVDMTIEISKTEDGYAYVNQ